MRGFPQELVDMVIDQLAEFSVEFEPFLSFVDISDYSTVSRQWLTRTQKHHFEFIHFTGQDDLEKWGTAIKADPEGVSRHARQLLWANLCTLKGFDEHISAFTRVEEVELSDCEIFRSLPDVEPFMLMGSSLVKLEIDGGLARPRVMASLLAGLPNLRHLLVHGLDIERGRDNTIQLPASIPFFEGSGTLNLALVDYSQGNLDWIPPTPRFSHLRIEALCVHHHWARVSQWIASSAGVLRYLSIEFNPLGTRSFRFDITIDRLSDCDFLPGSPFDPLDLSRCIALETLRLPVPLTQPAKFTDLVLPSLSSPRLSRVVLNLWESRVNQIDQIDHRAWETMDRHLCRLAKQFRATHGGRMMRVEVSMCYPGDASALKRLADGWPMPSLEKEATIVIPESVNWVDTGVWYRPHMAASV